VHESVDAEGHSVHEPFDPFATGEAAYAMIETVEHSEGFPSQPSVDRSEWLLDPSLVHLNHGSFGATPKAVLSARRDWTNRLEADPTGFFVDEFFPALDATRLRLSAFLDADPDGLAFVTNATTGVNVALAAVASRLRPGDEILLTDHTYNACRQAAEAIAGRTGVRVVVARIPFVAVSPDAVVAAVLGAVTARTRVALLDHVTSPTALVFPIERLVEALEPDIMVIVDAAHAPGMVPMCLRTSPASFVTGNLHKWVMAPKGAAFIHIRSDIRPHVDPLVIGHGWNATARATGDRFRQLFDWPGTFDPTAWLSVDAALDFGDRQPGGWPGLMSRNHTLVLAARRLLVDRLGLVVDVPSGMIGSMASIRVPSTLSRDADEQRPADRLRQRLRLEYGIVVPVVPWPDDGACLLRISAAPYNRPEDYSTLADALTRLLPD
jgi:isopenicillin-N epimerase